MAYRPLRDAIAATMSPADARGRDEDLAADAEAYIMRVAAELAVHHPTLAARLLLAYRATTGNGAEEERAWNALWPTALIAPGRPRCYSRIQGTSRSRWATCTRADESRR